MIIIALITISALIIKFNDSNSILLIAINGILIFLIIFLSSISNINAEVKRIISGNENAKITIIAYESLTCSHCANFHKKVIVKMREDESLNDIVNFVHKGFPLDLAALNAEKILYCSKNQENRFELLTKIYDKQKNWASRGDINVINESLMNISAKN